MKHNYFTTTEPCNYSAQDNMKHLYFKDYKHLQGVSFDEVDSEPLTHKVIASIGFIMTLLLILFI
jgi:hypothetical protein